MNHMNRKLGLNSAQNRRKQLQNGNHPRSEQFLEDYESARFYFFQGGVKYTPDGRIRWKKTCVFAEKYEGQCEKCHWCGRQMLQEDFTMNGTHRIPGQEFPTFEHLVPLASGGRDHPSNLVLVHHRCNKLRNEGKIGSQKEATLSAAVKAKR